MLLQMTSVFNIDFEYPATTPVFLAFKYLTSSPLRDFLHVLSKKSSTKVFFLLYFRIFLGRSFALVSST